jgi:hypothetical protein
MGVIRIQKAVSGNYFNPCFLRKTELDFDELFRNP